MLRIICLAFFSLVACTQKAQAPSKTSDLFVTLDGECGVLVPKGYARIRESADEVAFFTQGTPPGVHYSEAGRLSPADIYLRKLVGRLRSLQEGG